MCQRGKEGCRAAAEVIIESKNGNWGQTRSAYGLGGQGAPGERPGLSRRRRKRRAAQLAATAAFGGGTDAAAPAGAAAAAPSACAPSLASALSPPPPVAMRTILANLFFVESNCK